MKEKLVYQPCNTGIISNLSRPKNSSKNLDVANKNMTQYNAEVPIFIAAFSPYRSAS